MAARDDRAGGNGGADHARRVLVEELELDKRIVRLERTAERVEPMIPELEGIIEDRAYRARRRAEHGSLVKVWQLRLALAVGIVTLVSLLTSSVLTLLRLAGIA